MGSDGAARSETIAVDGLFAGRGLRIHPLPCGVGNKAVACEIRSGAHSLSIVGGGVEPEYLRGVGPVICGDGLLERVNCGVWVQTSFVAVVAGEEGDVILLTLCEDSGEVFGEEMAVDVRAEAWSALFPRDFHELLGGHGAKLFEGVRRKGLVSEGLVHGFDIVKGLEGEACVV